MLTAWRIVAARHEAKAFSGDGARLYGGRWNSKGVAVVYTAANLALASLEIVVNLPSPALLEDYIRIPVRFESGLVEVLNPETLPADWNHRPISPCTRAIGDSWVREQRSAVLCVPSIVVPEECNYLLNPLHPDFGRIHIGPPAVYHLDPRLAGRNKLPV